MDPREWFNCRSRTDAVDASAANAGEFKLYVMNMTAYTAVKGTRRRIENKKKARVAVKQADKNKAQVGG
jgi:hypothetical protein